MNTTEYIQLFEEEIKNLDFDLNPPELYEPIGYLLSLGGKRMRPVLLLMACEMFEGDIKTALPQALAIEIFHNFTLMHDDIMDNAPKRRNMPTVHEKWNENTAILSGDVMLICAYQQLCKSNAKYLPKLLQLFNQTAIEVCEGQQFDMNYETSNNITIAAYINMIRLKTAVLLGCSLKTGAIIAGATTENQQNMYNFGENIGIAFQLQDDLLDVFGNPDKFGKQVGGDILSNKKTFLYLKALELADESQNKELIYLFSATDFDPQQKIEAVVAIYKALDIKSKTQEIMQEYSTISLEYLSRVTLSATHKKPLAEFADKLLVREA